MLTLLQRLVITASLGVVTFGSAATADTPPSTLPVVVELFTSQGCSSCPPANERVRNIAKNDGVIALSYSVDYWDYLGWKDTFADRSFTERQVAYALTLGRRAPYTPQIVINGREDGPRFDEAAVLNGPLGAGPVLDVVNNDGDLKLTLTSSGDVPVDATIWLVTYQPGEQTVSVKGGENRGRQMHLVNVVTDIEDLGSWDGRPSYDVPELDTGEAYAILLQSGGTGPILAADTYTP